jgi:hypothetical protein
LVVDAAGIQHPRQQHAVRRPLVDRCARGERQVVDGDRIREILGAIPVFGPHHRNGLANVADPVDRERLPCDWNHPAGFQGDRPKAQLGGGDPAGSSQIDPAKPRVGSGRPNETHLHTAFEGQVRHILSPPGHQSLCSICAQPWHSYTASTIGS